ncbi:MAG: hypothetical protein ACI4C5_02655 [Lachnospiraceae bacterium]
MTRLIELREKIREFYSRYDRIIRFAVRFVLGLFTFLMINNYVGYMGALNHFYVALALALVCAPFSVNVILLVGAVMIILHLYALSMEVAVIALLFFLILFFLYFRFSPKNGYYVVVAPVAFTCHIPYVMPIAAGLLKEPSSIISIVFGTMTYYFLNGVHNNVALLEDVSTQGEATGKVVIALNQMIGNKEMYLVLAALLISLLVVYFIRRLHIDHAWSIAIFAGLLTEFVILCTGYLVMGISGRLLWLIVGSAISGVLGVLMEFFCFNLDYSRTEKVQFEDDEYYYYVKAIPKMNLSSQEKRIKKISKKL